MSLRALRDRLGRIGSLLVSILLRRPGDWLASRLTFLGLGPGCVQQTGMLILTDIEPGKTNALHNQLEVIRNRLLGYQKNKQQISFRNTETVHFAAWMILPGIKAAEGRPPGLDRLAFETNYDGSLVCHLNDLADNCRQELDDVYSFFPGYPPPGSKGPDVAEFLFKKFQDTNPDIDASAYYNALQGRPLEDINNALAVYYEAKRFIDNRANWTGNPRAALKNHFKNMPDGAPDKPVRFPVTHKGIRWLFVINMAVLLLLGFLPPLVLIFGYCWWRGLTGLFATIVAALMLLCLMPWLYFFRWGAIDIVARFFEWKEGRETFSDPTLRKPPDYSHLDLGRQNHLCTYSTVIPSCFRRYVIRRTLWLGPVLFNYFFILGRMDQIGTIHFGRWTLLGDQLLFYGNYDGSWSNYLTDFSDEAWGVNLVWGNTIGFPPTRFIVGAGARNLEGFQAQAAEHYVPAPVFYSAYRDHSLVNLIRYLKFRDEMLEEIEA
jgi:hypothetical protein